MGEKINMVEFHVLPTNDLIEHERPGDDCLCGPDVEFVENGVVMVHHSLDGRELHDIPQQYKIGFGVDKDVEGE
jgi:hypothetical protein